MTDLNKTDKIDNFDNLLNNIVQIKILSYNDDLKKFDAKDQNITNLSKPITDFDAVNLLTLKEYCFKNFSNELNAIKQDINRLYGILKYTDIDALDFSKLSLEDDLKEKIIYFKNIIDNTTQLLNEYLYKYNSLEKKTTLLEFKRINLENQIEELQEQIIQLQNDRLNKNKLTYVEEDVRIIYNQLKEYFNVLFNSTKLNFDKIYIDINFLNDKNAEYINLIQANKKKIDNITNNNNLMNFQGNSKSDIIDNCLYKIYINTDNINKDDQTINHDIKNSIIKPFINSKVYDDVKLCKIKYYMEYYNNDDILLGEKFNGYLKILVDKNNINLSSDTFITNLNINKENNFIESIIMPNVFRNNKNIKYLILYINLIFKIKLF